MITFLHLGELGRLGNQMFQIASSIGVATRNNMDYIFPEWEYNQFLSKKIPASDNIKSTVVAHENNILYKDIILKNKEHVYDFRGYFQSEKYFSHCSELIREHFTPNKEILKLLVEEKYHYLKYIDVTSVHVRRGDYVQIQKNHKDNPHPILPMEYYKQAMQLTKANVYLIFSDDIEWCKENFKGKEFLFVEERPHDKSKTESHGDLAEKDSREFLKEDFIELFLMSMCDNNIIANSSFSWWAAWLNINKDKKVVAPKLWFSEVYAEKTWGHPNKYLEALIPNSWEVL